MPSGFGVRQSPGALIRGVDSNVIGPVAKFKSARGLAHSKTWRQGYLWLHVNAAVDVQHLASDVSRAWRTKKEHWEYDVLYLAKMAQGNLGQELPRDRLRHPS